MNRARCPGHCRRAAPVLAALGAVLWSACKPLPPNAAWDAGPALLQGVTLQRVEGAHEAWVLRAPQASLALDGDRVALNQPQGRVFLSRDGGTVDVGARTVEASLGQGTAVAREAWAQDAPGRRLEAPRLVLGADASVVLADGPATLVGPNHRAVAQGGAVLTVATQEVELLGPVEASTLVGDAGILP